MQRANARRRAILIAALLAGCAGHPWPDEPGVPVAMSRAANVQAGDSFVAKLTADRRAASLPAPILAPQHEAGIRGLAEDLQAGKLTAGEALRASERWGRAAFEQPVTCWIVDCAAGENMKLPRALVDRPSAVLSYATAHFRPRSLASDQCAVLVVAIEGGEAIVQPKP